MENTVFIALSRQMAMQRQMDVIANNLANANTSGFKAQRMMFAEHLVQVRHVDRFPGGRELAFASDVKVYRDLSEGPLRHTGNPLDIAIHGEGYFAVDTPNGERYTRHGHFRLNETGQMVTDDGNPVLSNTNQPIVITGADRRIDVARDGTVSTDNGVIGRIRVVRFADENAVRKEANSLYAADSPPTALDRPSVEQGFIEESNVKPIIELTQMMTTMREFQVVSQMLERENERQSQAIDKLTRASAA
ncbi:MAG: flagellar basal-body rod protein FlgF [Proteobacteria bacterium]|nr:flagellar basal-body rod protein FlgF [Pseudomonadota bacterium]